MCRPARNLRCTGRGCPLGRLCSSLESCLSASSWPSHSQAPGLERTQERNNPHRAKFVYSLLFPRGSCWKRVIGLSWHTVQFENERVQCVLLNICTHDRPLKAVRQSPKYSFLSYLVKNALEKSRILKSAVISFRLLESSSRLTTLAALPYNYPHRPGPDSWWFSLPQAGPVRGPDNQKWRPGQQWGTNTRVHHQTKQEIGSGR